MSSTTTTAASRRPQAQPAKKWNPIKIAERKYFEFHRNLWATLSFGMLEPWEIILVCSIVTVVSMLLWYSLYFHFPSHARNVIRRAVYYIYGYTPTPAASVSEELKDIAQNVMHAEL